MKKGEEEVRVVIGGEVQAEIEVDIEVELPLGDINTIDLLKVKEEGLKEEKVLDIIWEFMNYL